MKLLLFIIRMHCNKRNGGLHFLKILSKYHCAKIRVKEFVGYTANGINLKKKKCVSVSDFTNCCCFLTADDDRTKGVR